MDLSKKIRNSMHMSGCGLWIESHTCRCHLTHSPSICQLILTQTHKLISFILVAIDFFDLRWMDWDEFSKSFKIRFWWKTDSSTVERRSVGDPKRGHRYRTQLVSKIQNVERDIYASREIAVQHVIDSSLLQICMESTLWHLEIWKFEDGYRKLRGGWRI